jgi:hypothetical protein
MSHPGAQFYSKSEKTTIVSACASLTGRGWIQPTLNPELDKVTEG